jgi:hypothetical protein
MEYLAVIKTSAVRKSLTVQTVLRRENQDFKGRACLTSLEKLLYFKKYED